MGLKDRFEGIASDGAITESEAVKACIAYNRELQKELESLRKNQKESKFDRLLNTYIHWNRTYASEGMFFAHIVGGLAFVGILWLFGLFVNHMHGAYLERTSRAPIIEGYYMEGEWTSVDGKNVACYQITFRQGNGEESKAAPCIVNRDEAFSVLAQLQELFRAGRVSKEGKPDESRTVPVR